MKKLKCKCCKTHFATMFPPCMVCKHKYIPRENRYIKISYEAWQHAIATTSYVLEKFNVTKEEWSHYLRLADTEMQKGLRKNGNKSEL